MYLVIVIHPCRGRTRDPPESVAIPGRGRTRRQRFGGFRALCAEPAEEGTGSHCSPQDSGTVQRFDVISIGKAALISQPLQQAIAKAVRVRTRMPAASNASSRP